MNIKYIFLFLYFAMNYLAVQSVLNKDATTSTTEDTATSTSDNTEIPENVVAAYEKALRHFKRTQQGTLFTGQVLACLESKNVQYVTKYFNGKHFVTVNKFQFWKIMVTASENTGETIEDLLKKVPS